MFRIIRSKAYPLTFFSLLILSLQMSYSSANNPQLGQSGWALVSSCITPLQSVTHEITETVKYFWSRYIFLSNVALQNEILKIELRDVRRENGALIEQGIENRHLRDLLNFKQKNNFDSVVANVIGKDPSNWLMAITIDQGSEQGVQIGLPVTNGAFAIGQIAAVSANASTVLLITDPASSIASITQQGRVVGMVEGGFQSDKVDLNYVEKLISTPINLGEPVLTAGSDNIFPKGLTIGHVSHVGEVQGSLFQKIAVRPAADLNKLEIVMVLIRQEKIFSDIDDKRLDK